METRKNLKLLAFATVISLVLSSFLTVNAIADDVAPPAESGTAQQSTEEPTAEETSVPEAPVVTEEPVAEEPSVSDAPAMTEEASVESTPQTLPEVLENLPQETEVVVLVDKQIEPLVTQTAANAFVAGDPIWCEDGVAPVAGAIGCTDSYTSLLLLLNDIESGSALNFSAVNGTIWIQGNDSSTGAIDIDSLTFTGWSSASLTLQGGWDGTSNLGSNILITPSTFSRPISITDWGANITINNITVSGTNDTGLDIQTTGAVSLVDVISNGNTGSGIVVDADNGIELENVTANNNTLGASLTTDGGTIDIRGSNFQDNRETGLLADADGDVTLENVNASDNGAGGVGGSGADITSNNGSVSLSGFNFFTTNLDSGLVIDAAVDIDAENIQANGNGGSGADLAGGGDISIYGSNAFDANLGGSGLVIDSGGDINIDSTSFSASTNDASGIDLTAVNSISLLGPANTLNGNGAEGLLADAGSDIDLENITANSNAVGASLTLLGSLSLSGANVFNDNDGIGLSADASGDIDTENLTAMQNGLVNGPAYGVELYAGGNVFLSGVVNVFIGNGSSGLVVDAFGAIEAENITANQNGGTGAEFTTQSTFDLFGSNIFNQNVLDGLAVDAVGVVSLENVTALSNGGSGVFIESDAAAVIDCGSALGNGFYEIETDLGGFLTLAGVNFGDDLDRLGVDEDYLVLVSNGCHSYPGSLFAFDDDDDDEDSNTGGATPPPAFIPPLPVNVVNAQNGELIRLQCNVYQGTQLRTQAGEAYIPCPIVDSARLLTIPPSALPGVLPAGTSFISSMHLAITRDGLSYSPPNVPGSIWYTDVSASDVNFDKQVVYWNGSEWVDITGSLSSFIRLFFPLTDHMAQKDLAILYWDGSGWVELSDGLYFENGGVVLAGGFIDNGFFQTMTNFIGTFVLVEK